MVVTLQHYPVTLPNTIDKWPITLLDIRMTIHIKVAQDQGSLQNLEGSIIDHVSTGTQDTGTVVLNTILVLSFMWLFLNNIGNYFNTI